MCSILFGFSQFFACRFEVVGCVDAYVVAVGTEYFYGVAVLKPPQLLKSFAELERRLVETGYLAERFGAIGVEANVFEKSVLAEPLCVVALAQVWHRCAAEIESVAVGAAHHLHVVWRVEFLLRGNGLRQCCDFDCAVAESREQGGYLCLVDERLVALHVQHHVEVFALLAEFFHYLAAALGAAAVAACGHDADPSEAPHGLGYALVVGGHAHLIDAVDTAHPCVDPFNHRPATQVGKWFAGEAARSVACRYDGDGFQWKMV